ncbi:MAG: hypothetical protein ABFC96_14960 [Thermoguttaceae bacterium]
MHVAGRLTLSCLVVILVVGRALASPPASGGDAPIVWRTDYARAMAEAERQNAMLLIYFCDKESELCRRFTEETLGDGQVTARLRPYVCVKLPLTAKITVHGKPVVLLENESFAEMQGNPGIAIVDFRSPKEPQRGAVVSLFPITERLGYSPEQMVVILGLPAGTLTQRTLIYAVRTHPEKPESTGGEPLPDLVEEAESHSKYQADIRVQGHHFWDSRFRRIIARLPGGLTAREVCAESWPGENLVEAAIDCVDCWRSSSGHWDAVRSRHPFFGYDMKRGDNGVWYATGIFGGG